MEAVDAKKEATISYTQFSQVDIRVGTIVQVDPFPQAKKPSYQLVVDFGPEVGRRKSSAQIASFYKDPNELRNRAKITCMI